MARKVNDIDPPAILFVCLGNICRSPLAQAAFQSAADKAGLPAFVDSAGTGDWHIGRPPDLRAQAVALRNGVDIAGYRARQIEPADYRRFSHIFALDHDNLRDIRQRMPADGTAQVGLLLDMVDGRVGQSVVDPYFGEEAGFDITWHDVTLAADALVRRLENGEG
jgi:protein-tyrosine phosphatase